MAIYSLKEVYDTTPERLFALLTDPDRLLEWMPPEFGLSWLEQPEKWSVGTVFSLQARRWGLSVRLVHEVVAWHWPSHFAERQQRGPFRSWQREWHLQAQAAQTLMQETISLEPPGGMLGQFWTLAHIEADIQAGWRYREQQLRACLAKAAKENP